MKRLLAPLFAVLLLSFGVIAHAQENGTIDANDVIDDREIDARIEAIFDEMDGLQAVFVTVRAGVVTLRGKVREATLAEQAEEIAGRVKGVVAVKNEIGEVTSLSLRLEPVYDRLLRRGAQAIGYIPLLAVAVTVWALIYAIGWMIAGREWPWNRIAPNGFIASLLRQLLRLSFFIAGAVMALDILGATALLGTILGAAGIVGLAIGFAVRDTVENYIASILLSVRQPFSPRDYVSIENFEGFVISLTSRATILMDADGNHIRIPNATVFKSNITNYSRNPQRRFLFRIGVAPESNLDMALEHALRKIRTLDFVLPDPGVDGWIEEIGDSTVTLTLTAWIDQNKTSFLKARSEAMRLVKVELERHGITLPEPTYRLRFAEGSALPIPAKAGAPAPGPAAPVGEPPVPEESTVVNDTRPDLAVTRKIEEERTHAAKDDLLSEKHPDELNG
ncbi:mechanosensitive ion channel family protein [Oricola sp.]|uniref:mechanosensitive ion channel family protein n=1 Tax=Oricola sp. TaxID=1979950 RepID=UPI0025EC9B46|nr:mechanosensitive ion channel family protein [Oricola sp.]MCI5073461.1 mechanosensitive ion channel [Oricola sp.]